MLLSRKVSELQTRKARGEKGFSLIEMLVVVIIIGVVAAITVPLFLNQQEKAEEASTKTTLIALAKTLATGQGTGGTASVADGILSVTDGAGGVTTVPLNGASVTGSSDLSSGTWCISLNGYGIGAGEASPSTSSTCAERVCSLAPIPVDLDGDGWLNEVETGRGSDPNNASSVPADADGDWSPDSEETARGTNPNDPTSFPRVSSLIVKYTAGFDPSGQVVGSELVCNQYGSSMTLGNALGGDTYSINFGSLIPVGDAREVILQMSTHPNIVFTEVSWPVGGFGGGGGGIILS